MYTIVDGGEGIRLHQAGLGHALLGFQAETSTHPSPLHRPRVWCLHIHVHQQPQNRQVKALMTQGSHLQGQPVIRLMPNPAPGSPVFCKPLRVAGPDVLHGLVQHLLG